MLTISTIGLIKYLCPQKNVHISGPAIHRMTAMQGLQMISHIKYIMQTVLKNQWTYTCLLTVITTEYRSVYLGEKHAPVEERGNLYVNPVIIPFVRRQMDSAVKHGLKENSTLKVRFVRKLCIQHTWSLVSTYWQIKT